MKFHDATQIVTHARPHIDDLAAMWLLKRFYAPLAEAKLGFLQRPKDGQFAIADDAVAVGIGMGQFDEHKGDVGECAATLVWQWLVEQPEFQVEQLTRAALERIVRWVQQEDLAELKGERLWQWTVTVPVEQQWNLTQDPEKIYGLAERILDILLEYYKGLAALDRDWEARQEFTSQWGKAVAIETSAGGVSERAYQSGAVLVVQIDPSSGARQFRAAGTATGVDLTAIYERVHAQEPEASWFLHPAKTLLLCGSRTAPDFNPSVLSLEEMVALVRE